MNSVAEKVGTLWPEIVMLIGAMVCLFLGLGSTQKARKAAAPVAGATLILAALIAPLMDLPRSGVGLGAMAGYLKLAILGVGFVLLLLAAKVPEGLNQVKRAEAARKFEPGMNVRGEFFAFFLMSLTGAMLTAGADDLVWLFLALELTSLPTYVLVASGRDHIDAHESAVKYFFLGAMGAAMFLYGFALIYGATGFTAFAVYNSDGQMVGGICHAVSEQMNRTGSISPLMLTGLMLSIVGIGFKIAAVPMHFYAADVYQGASVSVSAFLAFVPKTAGFAALILLLATVGWPLDRTAAGGGGDALVALLWIMAAATMTVGNVLALVQNNIKRVLAYSSVAHSGYMLVGLLAGTTLIHGAAGQSGTAAQPDNAIGGALGNGLAGVLFYLVAYGLATIGAFAVLGCLQRSRGETSTAHETADEAQTFDDIGGLIRTHPGLAAVMIVSMLSLIGLPPLAGFLGKMYLIGPAYHAGFGWLVLITVINSAISAAYYLRIAGACVFRSPPTPHRVTLVDAPARRIGAAIAAILAVGLGFGGAGLVNWANQAATPTVVPSAQTSTASNPDANEPSQSRGTANPRLSEK